MYKFLALLAIAGCLMGASKPKVVEWQTEKSYHFGSVELGSVTGIVFTFKNISDQPILLQTVRTTCGCTAAQWPEKPIAPGQTGDIRIEYSADRSGGFSKKIRVFFDAIKKPEMLKITGVVE